jgi:hypothetical protein
MRFFKYFILVFSMTIVSCVEDNPIIQEPDIPQIPEEPMFQYTKEKIFLFEVNLYSDIMKFFKYNTKVKQINPNVSIPDEVLKQMEDSLNSIVTYPTSLNKGKAIVNDIVYEINEHIYDKFSLGFSVYVEESGKPLTEDNYVTEQYSVHGRDSIIALFNRQNISGHFTTFEHRPNTFRPIISSEFRYGIVGFEEGHNAFFNICDKNIGYIGDLQVPSTASFKVPLVIQQPDIYLNEHALVYDRFNGREYLAKDGVLYKTMVVVKKLVDIKDFDSTAPSPNKPDLLKQYPVIQFYRNGSLWLEAWISKYTEEFEYNRATNKTTTNVGFDCYTLKNRYHYWIQYDSYCSKQFVIYVSDFSKPDGNNDFTRISVERINITNDKKEGAKSTISIE